MTRKQYTAEFKTQALELARQLGSYAKAAKELGISDKLIYYWKRQYGFSIDPTGKSAAQAVAETAEVKELKKRISELEKTNYILKRAAAFFSQDHLK
jgi:transposase